nr:hypothetical protein [uncultured Bacillus sp.]
MNKWLWYSLVLVATVLLILSFLTGELVIALATLGLTLFLKRYYHQIPLPKFYTKHKIYSNISGKVYDPSNLNRDGK